MLAHDFEYENSIRPEDLSALNYTITLLQAEEFCYLRVRNDLGNLEEVLPYAASATRYSKNVCLSIPFEWTANQEVMAKLRAIPITKLGLRITLADARDQKYLGSGSFSGGDEALLIRWAQLEKDLSDFQLTPELSFHNPNLHLAPTAARLLASKSPWLVLDVPREPTPFLAKEASALFEYLQIRGVKRKFVFFPFASPRRLEWDMKTLNPFCGPQQIDLDISNRCTHSCVFCGLYGPDFLAKQREDNNGQVLHEHMSLEIDPDKCREILSSLPVTTELVQFGGAGDPLIHPNAVEFIKMARDHGRRVEILSNMEYLDEEKIQTLHSVGGSNPKELFIYINLSGATEETYLRTRPRQSAKTYAKILHNISKLSEMRKNNNGRGVHFSLLCVVNSLNHHELHLYPELAKELGAESIFWKPVEVHAELHRKYIPTNDMMLTYARNLQSGLENADELGVEVFLRENCEALVDEYLGSPNKKKNKETVSVDVKDGGVSADRYTEIPCTIGYTYIRFQVDGTVKSCCIAKHNIGEIKSQHWMDVWHSLAAFSFRRKMLRINKEHFHLHDPEWAFCQQCSHRPRNTDNAKFTVWKEKQPLPASRPAEAEAQPFLPMI